jgi:hypothetical protein
MIDIRKTGTGTATVTDQTSGATYTARFDPAARRWTVDLNGTLRTTTSPKLKSIAALFGPAVNVTGGAPKRPAGPRRPRAPRAPHRPTTRKVFASGPTAADLKLEALAKIEDALAAALGEATTITPEQEKAFDRYQKIKALALGKLQSLQLGTPGTTPAEANTALRTAIIDAVKLAF